MIYTKIFTFSAVGSILKDKLDTEKINCYNTMNITVIYLKKDDYNFLYDIANILLQLRVPFAISTCSYKKLFYRFGYEYSNVSCDHVNYLFNDYFKKYSLTDEEINNINLVKLMGNI